VVLCLKWRTPLSPEKVSPEDELRTIIFTPTGKDGQLIAALFERLEIPCHIARTMDETCRLVAERWPVLDDRRRWRLGEITVPWSAVAPAG